MLNTLCEEDKIPTISKNINELFVGLEMHLRKSAGPFKGVNSSN